MKANAYEYLKMTDKMFYGVALTDEHMNNAVENIRKYLVASGALEIVDRLGIGMRIEERDGKVVRRRMIYLSGENRGKELSIHEMQNIGMFLRGGAYYVA